MSLNELPNELITNHVIPYLNIKSKYQFGLVRRKYSEMVADDLRKRVRELKRLDIKMTHVLSYYDHPLSGYAKNGLGETILFKVANIPVKEFSGYPDYFVSSLIIDYGENGNVYMDGRWWSFKDKPDVSKLPADMFQDKDGTFATVCDWSYGEIMSEPWHVSSFCIFDTYIVPADWRNNFSQSPSNEILNKWVYLGRVSEKYFDKSHCVVV